MAKPRTPPKPLTPQLDPREIPPAVDRLAKAGALQVLVRGALPLALLKRLLKDDVRKEEAATLPDEGWANLAISVLYESAEFEVELAELLQERLGWDRPPASLEDWFLGAADRPLETLWNAAFSGDKTLRKEFPRLAAQCLEGWRASPACLPPTWGYVEALLTHQAKQDQDLRDLERALGDAERRLESERLRVEELREELKRLRREGAELRAERAQAWRRAEGEREQARAREGEIDQKRIEELERRARKSEKEREHALAELERLRARLQAEPVPGTVEAGEEPEPEDDAGDEDGSAVSGLAPHARAAPDRAQALPELEDRRGPHPRGQRLPGRARPREGPGQGGHGPALPRGLAAAQAHRGRPARLARAGAPARDPGPHRRRGQQPAPAGLHRGVR
jgi:hypothetical protein